MMIALLEALPALAALAMMKKGMDEMEGEISELEGDLLAFEEYPSEAELDEQEIQLEVLADLQQVLDDGKPSHLTSKEWLGMLREAYKHLEALED